LLNFCSLKLYIDAYQRYDSPAKRKGNNKYCVNISETADKYNETQLITNVSVKPNIHSNITFLKNKFEDLKNKTDMDILIVDGGYTNKTTWQLARESNTTLIESGDYGSCRRKLDLF
jgi:predicted transcriptional regulator